MLGLERVLAAETPATASGTALRRHQIDALAGMLTELIAATQRSAEENGNGSGNGSVAELVDEQEDEDEEDVELRRRARPHGVRRGGPRRVAPLPLPPPDRVREDDRRGGVPRGRAAPRRPDPHPPPAARRPVPPRPHDRGLRRPADRRDRGRQGAASRRPDHDPDVRLVRATRRRALAHRVPARDLRRGPHRARREDLERDPPLPEPLYIGMTATEQLIAKQVSTSSPPPSTTSP